jgi:hypothetical protein
MGHLISDSLSHPLILRCQTRVCLDHLQDAKGMGRRQDQESVKVWRTTAQENVRGMDTDRCGVHRVEEQLDRYLGGPRFHAESIALLADDNVPLVDGDDAMKVHVPEMHELFSLNPKP